MVPLGVGIHLLLQAVSGVDVRIRWSPRAVLPLIVGCRGIAPYTGAPSSYPASPTSARAWGGGAGARGTGPAREGMALDYRHGRGWGSITSGWRYHIWGPQAPDMAGGGRTARSGRLPWEGWTS
jgi:hypothetical protein